MQRSDIRIIKKKFICLLLVLSLFCGITACGFTGIDNKKEASEKYSNMFYDAFDTVITIAAYCNSKEEFDEIFDFCREEFIRYHKLYDIYNSYDGIVNLKDINETAGQKPVKADPDIMDLLLFAKEMYEKTDGKVNAAMGTVLSLWHEAREAANKGLSDNPKIPDEESLKDAALHCSIEEVVIDETNGTVFFEDPFLKLDVGALAKGYASEKIAQALIAKGFDHILINAGGNIRAVGSKSGDVDWTIGIQNPDLNSKDSYVETVKISGMSVVTSGVYERNFTVNGITYHHIIDPDTLFPENRYLSVSVKAESSALADALSTALFNMDSEKGLEYVNSLDGVEAMWILDDNSFVYSNAFLDL